jgi:spore germination cell wall hydrolase CwlJ-like protein
MADLEVDELAAMIYGEVGSKDFNTMVKVGSSAIKRAAYGGEFGDNIIDVIHSEKSPYYAVSQNSPMYQQAKSGKFPDEESETKYKMARQAAYGLTSGNIDPEDVMFFFTPKEDKRQKKAGKKVFDYGKVRSTIKDDTYNYYSY